MSLLFSVRREKQPSEENQFRRTKRSHFSRIWKPVIPCLPPGRNDGRRAEIRRQRDNRALTAALAEYLLEFISSSAR